MMSICRDVTEKHSQWYSMAVTLAESLDVPIQKPRTTSRQRNRNNAPSTSTEEYFRRSVTIPFLDHMVAELQSRFASTQHTTASGFAAIPQNVLDQPQTWLKDFQAFYDKYSEDLPSLQSLPKELEIWQYHCQKRSDAGLPIPNTIPETVKMIDNTLFPNISSALKVLACIPITTCECERSVSKLRLLKTYSRSTMGASRLNGLALLHVHYTMPVHASDIVDKFARTHPRKLELADIL